MIPGLFSRKREVYMQNSLKAVASMGVKQRINVVEVRRLCKRLRGLVLSIEAKYRVKNCLGAIE
jgi:hypothetical protein